jgi:hypothetical protein
MVKRLTLCALAIATLSMGGCIIHERPPPEQAGAATISVGTTQSYWVNSYPPESLYETMTPSPGYGFVWIDGYWHWNGYDWGWTRGRWVRNRAGFVYVSPYYDYLNGRYVYRNGYWSHRSRLPRSVRVRRYRDGRPPTYRPALRDRRGVRGAPRPRVRDRRSPSRDNRFRGRPPVRDRRTNRAPRRGSDNRFRGRSRVRDRRTDRPPPRRR